MSAYEALKREILNLPNMITIGRLFLIPPVIWLIDPTDPLRNLVASLIFAAASGLDILDGYLARKQGLVTVFGKFVDPLADKLMAMSAMIYLVVVNLLPAWIVVVMLGRDLYINGIRQIAAERGIVIAAGEGGKMKTVFQLVGICCVLVRYAYRVPGFDVRFDFHAAGMMFLYMALALSLTSAVTYTLGFRNGLRGQA
ncbi:MAG: CDP-diacylglycerol--glycerol-3-phosphate 3-phosphatidyltransferase [Myxococcota bacterium]